LPSDLPIRACLLAPLIRGSCEDGAKPKVEGAPLP
jgi:hypothetical protein